MTILREGLSAHAPRCRALAPHPDRHTRACAIKMDPPHCSRRSPSEPIPADARKSCKAVSTARRPARAVWHREIEELGYGHKLTDRDDTQPKVQPGHQHQVRGLPRLREGSVGGACAPPVNVRLRRDLLLAGCTRACVQIQGERVALCAGVGCHSMHGRALDRGAERECWGVESHARSKIRATPSWRQAPGCVSMRVQCHAADVCRIRSWGVMRPDDREKTIISTAAHDWVSSLAKHGDVAHVRRALECHSPSDTYALGTPHGRLRRRVPCVALCLCVR